MFKYVRTINAHISAPEIFYLKAAYSSAIYENSVYTIEDSGYLAPVLAENRTKYIALENKPTGIERDVKCMRVMPGMVFETISSVDPQYFKVGLRGVASESSGNALDSFVDGGNELEIVDHHYSENSNSLLVSFI